MKYQKNICKLFFSLLLGAVALSVAVCGLVEQAFALPWRLDRQVRAELDKLTDLGRHKILIDLKPTTLTLSGYVSSEKDLKEVLAATSKVVGNQREIVNALQVKNRITNGASEANSVMSNDEWQVAQGLRERIRSLPLTGAYKVDLSFSKSGEVNIAGNVASNRDKELIEKALWSDPKVKSVNSLLQIQLVPDQELTRALVRAFEADNIKLGNVKFEVRDGVAHFSGRVNNHREIDRILATTIMVKGLRDIRSTVHVPEQFGKRQG
ncbi:MAG TPA: BON domain-containing protein [Oligoflexia bacterium]|nr:BON domain-containing protein [Oligoflexia bacterium]HMP27208.1 BON domain-containing protein [Oligoflexia bacterium]